MALVPNKLTYVSPADLYVTLRNAWPRVIQDATPTRSSILVLLAHWALETGFGHFTHCWNIGNQKHVDGDGHDYTQFPCNEVVNGKIVWYEPPDPACSFLAFETLDAGTLCYLTAMRSRFRTAWPAVLAGDPAGFCHLLKLARYYTADEGVYTAGVVRCYHQLDASVPIDGAPGIQAAVDEVVGQMSHDTDPPPPADVG